jgi:hypothetical protein
MKIDLALLCDAATVDPSGKLNVLGVFDRIHAREFPARHGRLCLVLRLETRAADAGDRTAEIRLETPSGEDLVRLDGKIHVGPATTDQPSRIPQVLNLDGIVFPEAGTYHFEVAIDGEALARVPLILQAAARSGGPATAGPEGIPLVFAPGGPAQA